MGRKPYPIALMEATNGKNRLTKNKIEERKKNEPIIDSAKLTCPKHLGEVAKKEWRRIVKLYKSLDNPIVTDLDKNALEVYCVAFERFREAELCMQDSTMVFKSGPYDEPKRNPYIMIANQSADIMKKYGEILLLDPVSRARASLSTNKKPEDMTPIEAFRARRAQGG
jgi:P27 family predicted phage terminase small subunit